MVVAALWAPTPDATTDGYDPREKDLGLVTDVWARWDSAWFLRIAEGGYGKFAGDASFYPLYPALVALGGRLLGGHYVLAGDVISTAAAFGASHLLYRLAEEKFGARAARRAVIYLLVFPSSIFLQAVYSESLFLLLAVASFLLAERSRFALCGVVTGLALLTRPTGFALLPALAYFAWRSPAPARQLARLSTAIVLFAAYPMLLWIQTGSPTTFLHTEGLWARETHALGPLGGLWDGLRAAWAAILQLTVGTAEQPYWTPVHSDRVALTNLEYSAYLALFLLLTVWVWRRLGAAYGLFAAASLAIPLSVPSDLHPLLSLPRFGLVVFPFFIVLGVTAIRKAPQVAIVAISLVLLAATIARWSLWLWVA